MLRPRATECPRGAEVENMARLTWILKNEILSLGKTSKAKILCARNNETSQIARNHFG